MNNQLTSEMLLCFTSTEINLVHCDYQCLIRYLDVHGLSIGTWSISEGRSALVYHLLFRMCATRQGNRCKAIAALLSKHEMTVIVSNILSSLCENGKIKLGDARFFCNVVGLTVPSTSSIGDMSSQLSNSLIANHGPDESFDLQGFLSVLDRTFKVDVYQWYSEHGLYAFGSTAVVKQLLLKYVMAGRCHEREGRVCRQVVNQHVTTFPDADKLAFPLSVVCITTHCSVETISKILQMTTGQRHSG